MPGTAPDVRDTQMNKQRLQAQITHTPMETALGGTAGLTQLGPLAWMSRMTGLLGSPLDVLTPCSLIFLSGLPICLLKYCSQRGEVLWQDTADLQTASGRLNPVSF